MAQQSWIRRRGFEILLAFLVPAFIWYWLERQHVGLHVVLAADVSVVSLEPGLADGITVTYGADTVAVVRAIEMTVSNSGNVPIRASDFEGPLIIELPARVIGQPRVTQARSSSIQPVVSADGKTVVVQPLLMNDDDAFTIRTLLADWSDPEIPIQVRARVSGVRDVSYADGARVATDDDDDAFWPWLGGFYALVFLVLGVQALARRVRLPAKVNAIPERRRALNLDDEQRRNAAAMGRLLEEKYVNPRDRLVQLRNEVEIAVRNLAVSHVGMLAFREKEIGKLIDRIAASGGLDAPLPSALKAFLDVANDLLASGPRWRTEDDLQAAVGFGADVAAQIQGKPAILALSAVEEAPRLAYQGP